MNKETERKIHQGAMLHGFIPTVKKDDPYQKKRQEIIYEFARYLVEEWKEL